MIVIEDIKFFETNRDPVEILHMTPSHMPILINDVLYEQETFRELIHGRRFIRPSDKTDIIVGIPEKSQKILGLMYEAWNNMEESLNSAQKMFFLAQEELRNIRKASFLKRLNWLFFGYK